MTSSTPPNTSGQPKESADTFSENIVVLGVGNVLLSDEGAGAHAARKLMGMGLLSGVHVVEGGSDGFRLIDVVAEADRLIVVDAVRRGGAPGSIYRFDLKDVLTHPDTHKTSVHQIDILEVIYLSELVGKTPKTTIIGVEPKSLDLGMELSPEVAAILPEIIELVFQEIKNPARNSK